MWRPVRVRVGEHETGEHEEEGNGHAEIGRSDCVVGEPEHPDEVMDEDGRCGNEAESGQGREVAG